MVCKNCGVRMKCKETANDPNKGHTARRYVCPECKGKMYTIEVPYDQQKVKYVMRTNKWGGKNAETYKKDYEARLSEM